MTETLAGVAWCVLAAVPSLAAQGTTPKTSFTGDLGYVSASGNTKLTTLSIGDKTVHSGGLWTFTQLGAYVYGETDARQSANQLRLAGRADVVVRRRLGMFGGVAFERNPFAGFRARYDEITGFRLQAIVAPVSQHIGVKINYAVRFDSRPPATFGTTDRVLTTGIQVTF